MNKRICRLASLLLLALAANVQAERADRSKPVNLEADKVTVDDKNKVHIFEGRVSLTQGTLTLRADKLVVTQDADGFQKGVAYGSPQLAHFRQKRDGREDWIEGEAERIEYDANTQSARFFNRARVLSGQDEVRGQYIQYDGVTENYIVTNGPNAGTVANSGGRDNRVKAVIQPRNKDVEKPAPAGAALQSAPGLPAPAPGKN
ncbi:MAG: lipopolysaccharide transport periplasmic protein LptA [Rhodocyclaceae bacterium]|nr:lipopolysaccharide transport periplasmic protein LptA [Rhodocyclaceae bacterium]MBX3666794.1 lipopolysaccharide transport periplasmic protein LptA [Rhodocyclaceae bacterium]